MSTILVAYATNAGSTAEVAEAIGEALRQGGAEVTVRPIDQGPGVEGYTAVIVGAPMIIGWHRSAVGFIRQHRQALAERPVAYFLMGLSLTQADHGLATAVSVDPDLAKPPRHPGRLSFPERHATVGHYVGPVLHEVPEVKPVAVGIFGGKLDPARLSWWQKLFVTGIIRAKPGDYRNWPFIRQWAAEVAGRIGP